MPDAKRWHESRQTPRRGCGQRSITAASSSTVRPIVPPAPAVFSSSSQTVLGQVGEHLRRARTWMRSRPASNPSPEVRADVHDHGLGVELATRPRSRPRARRPTSRRRRVGAREVDQVRGVADDRHVGRGAGVAERLEVLRRVRLRAPGARARREDLDRLAVERADPARWPSGCRRTCRRERRCAWKRSVSL